MIFFGFKLNESSGLTLGCALIELIQSEKFDNDEILFILDLLQVTCAESEEVKTIWFVLLLSIYFVVAV
jgi:hypothetical protein